MELTALEQEVLEQYEASLFVPPQPTRKQFILCPVGIVGAGKTTVLKPLAEKLALVRISGDDIRFLLKQRGLSYDGVVSIGAAISKKYLSEGYSLALDSDAASPRSKEVIEDAQEEFGVIPIWVHINPPEDFILNKLRTYKHTWLFKDADQAVQNYMNRKELHENLEEYPFVYTFDTSKTDLATQIAEAVAIIEPLTVLE
ncbi:MAG: hypothetical protein AB203_02395 [Parcubacteria bacterium C7867-008]|nr:MAG: hypothetical protein AB203_02395 [Parcubacteria bacterium C7867-008]